MTDLYDGIRPARKVRQAGSWFTVQVGPHGVSNPVTLKVMLQFPPDRHGALQ